MDYCVMVNEDTSIWCWAEDVEYHEKIGFRVYGYAKSEESADLLAEKACG